MDPMDLATWAGGALLVVGAVGALYRIVRGPSLLDRAVAEGLAPTTPALVVFNATRPNQTVLRGTAADLAERVDASGGQGPAILMVGEALALGVAVAETPVSEAALAV